MWISSGGQLRYTNNDYQGPHRLAAIIAAANNYNYTGELPPPPPYMDFSEPRWRNCVKRVAKEGPPPQFRNY